MVNAHISRYPAGVKPAILLPKDPRIPDGTPGPIFRYSAYADALRESALVSQLRLTEPTSGQILRSAFAAAIQYSDTMDRRSELLDQGTTQLILGRTGQFAVLHAAREKPRRRETPGLI